MKILITGSSGFLGSVMVNTLKGNHQITTLHRRSDADIVCDLSHQIPDLTDCDMIVHNAGKAHVVPKNATQSDAFTRVNYQGTLHLLMAIDKLQQKPKTLVFISTVAVYGAEQGVMITENHALDGNTPYALSKIKAEEAIQQYGRQHQISTVILRLPLVVAPQPPGNLGAMIKGIKKGYYFRIGDGQVKRSMVWAQDVAELIPNLLNKQGIYHLTDGVHPEFAALENKIAQQFGKRIKSLPMGLIKGIAKIGNIIPGFPLNRYRLQKLTATLTFSDEKARVELNWNPKPILNQTFL